MFNLCFKFTRSSAWSISLLLFCFGLGKSARAELIPLNRLAPSYQPGTHVGVTGGIPNRTTIFKNLYPTNTSTEISAAISACPPGQVVFLNAGTYNFSGVNTGAKSQYTVRGAGTNTVLNMSGPYGAFYVGIGSGFDYPKSDNVITSALIKGTTNYSIADTASFTVGGIVQIQFQNDTNVPVIHVSGHDYMRRHMGIVKAKSSTSLTIWPPLEGDYKGAGTARIQVNQLATATGVGFENLTINFANSTPTFGIILTTAANCWIKNVTTRNANNYHVYLDSVANCEVRDSWFEKGKGVGSNGAGILANTVSGCLIENNVILDSYPSFELNFGSSGNVIGYNFMLNTNGYFEIDSNHGPHNTYNLYEGNVAGKFMSDGYFGGESEATLFRNWFHGTLPNTTSLNQVLALKRFSRNFSIIGNILGRGTPYVMPGYDGISLGQPNMGNGSSSGFAPSWADWGKTIGPSGFQELDTNVFATTIRKGNYNYFTKSIPAGETLGTDTLPKSLYRIGTPAWFGNLNWPPFDPENPNPSYASIPAGYRYLNGTDVPGSVSTDQTSPSIPANVAITVEGPDRISLRWDAASDNVGVTEYSVERSAGDGSSSFGNVTTLLGTNFSDTGLSASTIYNYRVRALDAAMNFSSYSVVVTASTSNSEGGTTDQAAPTAPTNLKAEATGTNSIYLSWEPSTDNVGVVRYHVERSRGASTEFAQVDSPSGTSWGSAGLLSGTVYSFRIRAVDAAGNVSDYSLIATAKTTSASEEQAEDSVSPTAPSYLNAEASGADSIYLSWGRSSDNVGVTGYRVERSQGAGSTSFILVGSAGGTSWGSVDLSHGTVYNYRVCAVDAAGNVSGYSTVATATTRSKKPTAPASLRVSQGSD